jgi:Protein of unknown function (DUF4058)
METVNPIKNQYRGINAHLHSLLQGEGGWDSFHANQITYLTSYLTEQLLPMGYTAENIQSLQIRSLGEPAGKPESDVTIYDSDPFRAVQPPLMWAGSAQKSAVKIPDIMEIKEDVEPYRAIGIFEFVPGMSRLGEPVAWIELLSPSNKPGGSDVKDYRYKRLKLLKSGIVFVELDYLHETPSTFEYIPSYARTRTRRPFADGTHPYRIVVIDPRPEFIEGDAYSYHFDVDETIPGKVDIPLNAGEWLQFDFDAPYQEAFRRIFYGRKFVDYTRLPLNFDRYSPDDQARILNRMIVVLEAAQQGVDLDKVAEPLPVGDLSLEAALARVQGLGIIIEK